MGPLGNPRGHRSARFRVRVRGSGSNSCRALHRALGGRGGIGPGKWGARARPRGGSTAPRLCQHFPDVASTWLMKAGDGGRGGRPSACPPPPTALLTDSEARPWARKRSHRTERPPLPPARPAPHLPTGGRSELLAAPPAQISPLHPWDQFSQGIAF